MIQDPTHDVFLQVAQTVSRTEAEGPGRRFALWFQGCPLRCPGCCNPEMLSFSGGERRLLSDIMAKIDEATREGVEGVSLLGGEPLAHASAAAALASAVRARELTVMVYTGFTLEEARRLPDPGVSQLLSLTDLLVDGPYLRDQPEGQRRWVGSANQRVHFLTDRYQPDDPCWLRPNTLEIRLRGNELSVNGFPSRSAVPLWKRLRSLNAPDRTTQREGS